MTHEVSIGNKSSRLYREAEEITTSRREDGELGRGEFAEALRQHGSLCPRPLSDGTKPILPDITKKSGDWAHCVLSNWTLNFTGRVQE